MKAGRDAERLTGLLRHYDHSQLESQVFEIVRQRTYLRHGVTVGPGEVVLDVGANVGVAGAFFASVCGAGLVHSFEPVAPLYDLLRENLAQFPACVAHDYGLSSRSGQAEITYYPKIAVMSGMYADLERDRERLRRCLTNGGMSEEDADRALQGRHRAVTLTCEVRPLSTVLRELGLERIDLLKVDVEHAESDVLAGIEDGDWPRFRQVVVEAHAGDESPRSIESDLRGRGFEVAVEQDAMLRGTGVRTLYAIQP